MRIAVMSDIHGNLEALVRCLEDISSANVDQIVNLGDCIGYGPQPEEVLNLLEKRGVPNILGNHELAVVNKSCHMWFTKRTLESIEHTKRFITSESLSYIQTLPTKRVVEGALMVHGCPPNSPTIYLNQMCFFEIRAAFKSNGFKIAFTGHTHHLMLMCYDGKSLTADTLNRNPTELQAECRYIVNAGSVGQPRDNDPRAKYVIWDNCRNTLEVRRVEYNVGQTRDKIIKRGFQLSDANRLLRGT
jgi:predicted phosphodiesterase